MSDPDTDVLDPQSEPEVSDRLTKSLSSIWQHHAGARPSAVSTELSGDVVRFVMQDAISGISVQDADGDGAELRSPDTVGYRNEAIAAVRRITGRRVRGYIPKRDKKTDTATDTYVLEPMRIAR